MFFSLLENFMIRFILIYRAYNFLSETNRVSSMSDIEYKHLSVTNEEIPSTNAKT